jgi:mono/diheme cytochrome c family protein
MTAAMRRVQLEVRQRTRQALREYESGAHLEQRSGIAPAAVLRRCGLDSRASCGKHQDISLAISRDDRSPEACEARQARNERCQRPELSIAGIWRRFVPRSRILVILALELFGLVGPEPAKADQTTLVVVNDAGERRFTAAELLARPDNMLVSVSGDNYHHAVPYRAVPLLSLLGNYSNSQLDTVETQASDGFVSEIPLALIARGVSGGATAWLAVEDPAHPWPPLSHEPNSAGPFYLVWEHPERSGVTREQWPYKLLRLSLVESPDRRWPQLSVPATMSNDASTRRGHDVFLIQCLPCHRLNSGGASEVGPDLGWPMNPTQYLTEAGLRAIIRNPRAVRTWPGQYMLGFSKAILTDSDLDGLVAYLRAMAEKTIPIQANPN